MTTTQQRRPGVGTEAATVSRAADSRVQLALIDYTVRLALVDGSRLCLEDMPSRSNLVLDVSECRFPSVATVDEIATSARRGVRVEIVAASPAGVRAWHEAMSRARVRP